MLELLDILPACTRGGYYLIGVFVVTFVVFATAARRPSPRCPRCQEPNRPMAQFCAQCGHRLDEK